jgi:threonine aldolase
MTVDLRSDTVTLPNSDMLTAMTSASVGDDGRTEDPTVRKLEDRAAQLTGKSAALFVPSGTFGNMLGVLAQSRGSSPVWVRERAHILTSEKALFSSELFGRSCTEYSQLADVPATPPSEGSLLLVENTVSHDAGRPLSSQELDVLSHLHSAGWMIHMDGARLFNAAVSTGESADNIAASCDSVTFCLSKGLGAPIGSVLCGSSQTIARARQLRKQLGGAMRQAGYVAAAGLIALTDRNIHMLADDHRKARILYEAIGQIADGSLHCKTNIISVHLLSPIARRVVDLLEQRGFLVRALSDNELRILTHRDVTDEDARLAGEATAACIDAAAKEN